MMARFKHHYWIALLTLFAFALGQRGTLEAWLGLAMLVVAFLAVVRDVFSDLRLLGMVRPGPGHATVPAADQSQTHYRWTALAARSLLMFAILLLAAQISAKLLP